MAFLDNFRTKIKTRKKRKDAVFGLYNALVEEARKPELYARFKIPDTLDGRFDAIVYHIVLFGLATNQTADRDSELKNLGKDLIGVFLKDMDRNLREIGVGDLSVGKKVKKMASALYGRIDAYSRALSGKNRQEALARAVAKNIFRGRTVDPETARGLAAYGLEKFDCWKDLTPGDLKAGRIALK